MLRLRTDEQPHHHITATATTTSSSSSSSPQLRLSEFSLADCTASFRLEEAPSTKSNYFAADNVAISVSTVQRGTTTTGIGLLRLPVGPDGELPPHRDSAVMQSRANYKKQSAKLT